MPTISTRKSMHDAVTRQLARIGELYDALNEEYASVEQRLERADSDVRDLADHLGRLLSENPTQADRDAAREYLGQLVHRAAREA